MNKESVVKYPNSASLFQFCRKVLDHKFGGIRVIDQDVGQILGFDPADCSHWKKGKKNIRSIQAMKSIASHLGVDEKLIVDVASGDMSDWEAFQEYSGYGTFHLDSSLFDTAKKEFYRKFANTWTREKESEFRTFFDVNHIAIDRIVGQIHQKIDFHEAPLYLPEIIGAYPNLKMKPFDANAEETRTATIKTIQSESGLSIEYPTDIKMRPFIRFKIAKAMASYFFKEAGLELPNELGDYRSTIEDVHANLFAAKLLTPSHLLRREIATVNVAKDVVAQLAETFWVSKTFMNLRLKDILQNPIEV
ncbi:MAG: hypothetical protein HRU19_04185 [Pseudobacteriovorax sp.]|nr:hypothetical protein [Pseudobacteriovorax sp.]